MDDLGVPPETCLHDLGNCPIFFFARSTATSDTFGATCHSCGRWNCESQTSIFCNICGASFQFAQLSKDSRLTARDFQDLSGKLHQLIGEYTVKLGSSGVPVEKGSSSAPGHTTINRRPPSPPCPRDRRRRRREESSRSPERKRANSPRWKPSLRPPPSPAIGGGNLVLKPREPTQHHPNNTQRSAQHKPVVVPPRIFPPPAEPPSSPKPHRDQGAKGTGKSKDSKKAKKAKKNRGVNRRTWWEKIGIQGQEQARHCCKTHGKLRKQAASEKPG